MNESERRAELLPGFESLIEFKYDYLKGDMLLIKGVLLSILLEMATDFAAPRGLNFRVTRAIDGMVPGVSKTNIHADGRAVDISTRGWPEYQILLFEKQFNDKYGEAVGTGPQGKRKRVVVYENGVDAGRGAHLHIQINRNAKFSDLRGN